MPTTRPAIDLRTRSLQKAGAGAAPGCPSSNKTAAGSSRSATTRIKPAQDVLVASAQQRRQIADRAQVGLCNLPVAVGLRPPDLEFSEDLVGLVALVGEVRPDAALIGRDLHRGSPYPKSQRGARQKGTAPRVE